MASILDYKPSPGLKRLGPGDFFFSMLHRRTEFNQGLNETRSAWLLRIQSIVKLEVQALKKAGASTNRIVLLMPPKFLEKIYAVTYACELHEARDIIDRELRKLGFLSLFGSCVISNDSILYPAVEVIGDMRAAKRGTRMQEVKLFGGRIRSRT